MRWPFCLFDFLSFCPFFLWSGQCKTQSYMGHLHVGGKMLFLTKQVLPKVQCNIIVSTHFKFKSGVTCLNQVWTGLGPINKFTLVPVIHPRGPRSLQFQVCDNNKKHIKFCVESANKLKKKNNTRQDLVFYYIRGYAYPITAQQTQVCRHPNQ